MTAQFQVLPIAIDAVAKASLILSVTALAAAVLRRASASARHLVWALGLVSALAAPALSTVTPRWTLPIVRVPAAAPALDSGRPPRGGGSSVQRGSDQREAQAREARTVARDTRTRDKNPERTSVAVSSPVASGINGKLPSFSWTTLLLLLWSAGAGAILGRMIVGLIAVQWMSRRTAVVTDAPWLAQARA